MGSESGYRRDSREIGRLSFLGIGIVSGGGRADRAKGELLTTIVNSYRGIRFGKLHFPELGGIRQIIDGTDAEMLEKEIAGLGKEKESISSQLSNSDLPFEELQKLSHRIGEVSMLLDEKEMRWLELSEMME